MWETFLDDIEASGEYAIHGKGGAPGGGKITVSPGLGTTRIPISGGTLRAKTSTWTGLMNPVDELYMQHTQVQLAAGFSFVQGFLAGWGASWAGYGVGEWLGGDSYWDYIIGGASSFTLIGIAGQVHDYLYYEQWGMDPGKKWYYDMSFRSGSYLGAAFGTYQIAEMNFLDFDRGFDAGVEVGMTAGWSAPEPPPSYYQESDYYRMGWEAGMETGYHLDWAAQGVPATKAMQNWYDLYMQPGGWETVGPGSFGPGTGQ